MAAMTEREERGQRQQRPEPLQTQGGSQLKGEALRGGKTEAAVHGDSFLTAPRAGVAVQTTGGALCAPPQFAKAESGKKSVQNLKKKMRFSGRFQDDHGHSSEGTAAARENLSIRAFLDLL
jgi:hypothetical protein